MPPQPSGSDRECGRVRLDGRERDRDVTESLQPCRLEMRACTRMRLLEVRPSPSGILRPRPFGLAAASVSWSVWNCGRSSLELRPQPSGCAAHRVRLRRVVVVVTPFPRGHHSACRGRRAARHGRLVVEAVLPVVLLVARSAAETVRECGRERPYVNAAESVRT
jgi:hypothetical protein